MVETQSVSMRAMVLFLLCLQPFTSSFGAVPPKIGEPAPDFALKTLEGQTVRLSELNANQKVVLLVLRGWPGYQCPLCTAQVQDYISAADRFDAAKVKVLMVYPGPSENLKAHAREFLSTKQWPKNFLFIIDPDYTMVNAYGLRWDARSETAYPSTFVLQPKGVVKFAKISHGHGDRTKAADILAELKK